MSPKRSWLGLRLLYWLLVLLIGALIGVTLAHTTQHSTGNGATLDRQAAAACVTFDEWLKTGGLDKTRHDALLSAAAELPPKYAALGTHIDAALAAAGNHSVASLQRRGQIVLDECTTILTMPRG